MSAVLQALLPPISAVMLAGNKVMNKIVLVPLEPYTQFLAIALCVAYAVCYGGALTFLSMCALAAARILCCALLLRMPSALLVCSVAAAPSLEWPCAPSKLCTLARRIIGGAGALSASCGLAHLLHPRATSADTLIHSTSSIRSI